MSSLALSLLVGHVVAEGLGPLPYEVGLHNKGQRLLMAAGHTGNTDDKEGDGTTGDGALRVRERQGGEWGGW